MPRTIHIEVTDRDLSGAMLNRITEQNRVLYEDAVRRIIERERRLNRHLLEAQEAQVKILKQFDHLFRMVDQVEEADHLTKFLQEDSIRRITDLPGVEVFERAMETFRRHDELMNLFFPAYSDLMVLLNCEDLDCEEARTASRRFAKWFGLKLKNPIARKALSNRARSNQEDYAQMLLRRYLPAAIRKAVSQAGKLQRIRIGNKWEKVNGKVVPKVPRDLPFHKFYRWVKARAYRELSGSIDTADLAVSNLVQCQNDDVDDFAIDLFDLCPAEAGPIQADTVQEPNQDNLLAILDASLTDRQRELLTLYQLFFRPASEIAYEIGIADSTVRGHRKNVRYSLKKSLPKTSR